LLLLLGVFVFCILGAILAGIAALVGRLFPTGK
jgi:hypothetical protein